MGSTRWLQLVSGETARVPCQHRVDSRGSRARRVHRVSDARRCERQHLSRQPRVELLIHEVTMSRTPSFRSAGALSAFLALMMLLFFVRAHPLDAQDQGAANEFNDSHFHLTNY